MAKIFLFGDSITAGYYEEDITELLTQGVQEAFPLDQVVNAGIPGDTTFDALARVEAHVVKYQPEIVVVFFGANDMAVDRQVSIEEYQKNLTKLIELIGTQKVILLAAPYANQRLRQQDRPLARTEAFVQVAEALAVEYDLPFINTLKEMLKEAEPETLLQEDGLHFSKKGYVFLSRLINQQVQVKLKEKSEPNEQ